MNFNCSNINCFKYKNVACGIIKYNNKILISQRSENQKEFPLYWEFTGGKFEENENVCECITREVKEELNIDIKYIKTLYNKIYRNYNLHYCLCECKDISNIRINFEVIDYKLVNCEEILKMELIPGDLEILKEININKLINN